MGARAVHVSRPIVRIDEEKCTGCGECILACAEAAIQLVDGKAHIISERLCDGFGVCVGRCPEEAIVIEERQAEAFDEEAVKDHLASLWMGSDTAGTALPMRHEEPAAPCPSGRIAADGIDGPVPHWPIKLNLVPPAAPFLKGADVVLMADCVPFAAGDPYPDLIGDRSLLIGCPKFDDPDFALNRLTDIVHTGQLRSLTVVHMEVPCCAGYWHLARRAVAAAGADVRLRKIVVNISGRPLPADGQRDG